MAGDEHHIGPNEYGPNQIGPYQSRLKRGATRRGLLIGAGGLLLPAACKAPDPALSRGESGRVARVSDGDLLALDTGQRVRLVEIEAPSRGYRDRAGEPYAEDAAAVLSAAALGRTATLHYGGLSRDGYDRALAHVIVTDEAGAAIWLNGMMVRAGAARVRTWPDNAARARALLKLEAAARLDAAGLWALDAYRVRRPEDAQGLRGFVLIEGSLAGATGQGPPRAVFTGGAITLHLDPRLGPPPPGWTLATGAQVRVRGRIDTRGATPMIALTHWAQIEPIEA
ncbi:nuclease [bacterium]|nr:nuclease [bacterium]